GLWHGTFLVAERVIARRDDRRSSELATASTIAVVRRAFVGRVYAIGVVMIGWVFFRADTLGYAVAFLQALIGLGQSQPTPFTVQWYLTPELWLALVAGVIGSAPWVPVLAERIDAAAAHGRRTLAHGSAVMTTASLVLMLFASIMQMAARTYNPFIYFRF